MFPRRHAFVVAIVAALAALVICAASALGMQCTDWAAIKRPDLPTTQFGDAKDWDAHAAELGYVVDRRPARGDVAVWQAGQCTRDNHGCAGRYGHVAYVAALPSATRIRVSEANWPTGSGPRYAMVNPRGLTFIHLP
jgi:surface antigen